MTKRGFLSSICLAVLASAAASDTCDAGDLCSDMPVYTTGVCKDGLDLCEGVKEVPKTCKEEGLDLCDDLPEHTKTDNYQSFCKDEGLDLCEGYMAPSPTSPPSKPTAGPIWWDVPATAKPSVCTAPDTDLCLATVDFAGSFSFSANADMTVTKVERAAVKTLSGTTGVPEKSITAVCTKTGRRLDEVSLRQLAAASTWQVDWTMAAEEHVATAVGHRISNMTSNNEDFALEFKMQLVAAGVPEDVVRNMTVTEFAGAMKTSASTTLIIPFVEYETAGCSIQMPGAFSILAALVVSTLLYPQSKQLF